MKKEKLLKTIIKNPLNKEKERKSPVVYIPLPTITPRGHERPDQPADQISYRCQTFQTK